MSKTRLLRGLTVAALAGLADVARADKVGVAAAVNPDAFSTLAGAPQIQLNIGKSIFFNASTRLAAGWCRSFWWTARPSPSGPARTSSSTNPGEIAATYSKGVMRFVGGKISKNDDAVHIATPAGALAVRGCIVLGKMTNPANFGFLLVYGEYLKMKGLTVFEPGNGIFSKGRSGAAAEKPH